MAEPRCANEPQLNPSVDSQNLNLLHFEEQTASLGLSPEDKSPRTALSPHVKVTQMIFMLESTSFTRFLAVSISRCSRSICRASSWISW